MQVSILEQRAQATLKENRTEHIKRKRRRNAYDEEGEPTTSFISPLPRVDTQKQFMDVLETWVTPPKLLEPEEEGRGRPLELKSFIIENNGQLDRSFVANGMVGEIRDTGLDDLKILSLLRPKTDPTLEPDRIEFYLDMSHKRFLLLHTNFDSELTTRTVRDLVGSNKNQLDNAWLSTSMLNEVSAMPGNKKEGYRIGYRDPFRNRDANELVSEYDMLVEAKGGISKQLYRLADSDPEIRRTLGYEWLSISRGNVPHGVLEDLSHNGRFALRKGRSVGDHVILVKLVRDHYRDRVVEVEEHRIDAFKKDGFGSFRGAPFEFEFKREVRDWQPFLARLFDAKDPFRIWGMTSKVRDGYYRVLGVDMHTGHPLDVEIANHLIRVYLPKDSCGNVVMRLFVNLQRYFDATITCNQMSAIPIAS